MSRVLARCLLAALLVVGLRSPAVVGEEPSMVQGLSALPGSPMPGFVGAEEVTAIGSDHLVQVSSPFACEIVEGWLGAGDWRIETQRVVKLPSGKGAAKLPFKLPTDRWSILSDGEDLAVARLTRMGDGCVGRVTRLSRQQVDLTGRIKLSGEAATYPLQCIAGDGQVQLSMLHVLEHGTAVVTLTVPLELGEHRVDELSAAAGPLRLGAADLITLLSGVGPGKSRFEKKVTPLEARAPGHATVTSLEPFAGTYDLPDLAGPKGRVAAQGGFRCDLPAGTVAPAAGVDAEAAAPPDAPSSPAASPSALP